MGYGSGPACYQCGGSSEIYADGPTNFLAQCFHCELVMSLPGPMLDALFVRRKEYRKEMMAKEWLDRQLEPDDVASVRRHTMTHGCPQGVMAGSDGG